MSLQPLQGSLVLAFELRFRHLPGVDPTRELLAVLQRLLFLRAQRYTGPRGRLGAFSPFRVADTMRVALSPEAGDVLLESRGAVTLRPGSAQGDPEVAFPEDDAADAFALLVDVVKQLGRPQLSGLKNQLRKRRPSAATEVRGRPRPGSLLPGPGAVAGELDELVAQQRRAVAR